MGDRSGIHGLPLIEESRISGDLLIEFSEPRDVDVATRRAREVVAQSWRTVRTQRAANVFARAERTDARTRAGSTTWLDLGLDGVVILDVCGLGRFSRSTIPPDRIRGRTPPGSHQREGNWNLAMRFLAIQPALLESPHPLRSLSRAARDLSPVRSRPQLSVPDPPGDASSTACASHR